LTVKFVNTLIASGAPFLPGGISINVNYPAVSDTCNSVEAFEFVLSRIFWNPFATDVTTCGSSHLPTESSVVGTSGCFVSVSVFNANDKLDANAAKQGVVLSKLSSILSCLP
jgi:5'-nucleotidase